MSKQAHIIADQPAAGITCGRLPGGGFERGGASTGRPSFMGRGPSPTRGRGPGNRTTVGAGVRQELQTTPHTARNGTSVVRRFRVRWGCPVRDVSVRGPAPHREGRRCRVKPATAPPWADPSRLPANTKSRFVAGRRYGAACRKTPSLTTCTGTRPTPKAVGRYVVDGHEPNIDLFAYCANEGLFIPELVAIPRLWLGESLTDDDHVWHELLDVSVTKRPPDWYDHIGEPRGPFPHRPGGSVGPSNGLGPP